MVGPLRIRLPRGKSPKGDKSVELHHTTLESRPTTGRSKQTRIGFFLLIEFTPAAAT